MQPTEVSVEAFIDQVTNARRREDAWALLDLFKEITGYEPVMWGPSIIGFDSYHYIYASGREGDAPAAAFSPRSAHLVVYNTDEFEGFDDLIAHLGKHKLSKACLYINKLADVDMDVLRQIIEKSYRFTKEHLDSH